MAVASKVDRPWTGVRLALADGQRWVIRPTDEQSAEAVAELRQVMRLDPGDRGREIHVVVRRARVGAIDVATERGVLLCFLPPRLDRGLEVIQMETIASFVAQAAFRGRALLLHGALAEYCGSGFIMAGPGKVGKSTASRRLPPPWRSLCDDSTLVARDGMGQYWAHPWPTWSRFRESGPGGSWAVEQAVPLRAVFFLAQSPSDQLEPVNVMQATAMTLESAVSFACTVARLAEQAASQTLCRDEVSAAMALAGAVPTYSLHLSLDGQFWKEIEKVLPVGGTPSVRVRTIHSSIPTSSNPCSPPQAEPHVADGSLRTVYFGPSMNPTLQEPDLLVVRPYGTGRVRPGDVVCYKSPTTGTTVAHRVVSIGRRSPVAGHPIDGIRTRGDNNPTDDPWVLQAGDIIGRVVAAQRGTRRRVVPGGRQGFFALGCARLGQGIRRYAGLLPRTLYDFVAGLGPLDHLLPRSLRPQLVRFDARYRVFLKLLMGRQMVGQYDARQARWRIRRPFRLFMDEQTIRDAGSVVSRNEPGRVP
ncbi:MAG: SynChlorMet cassette protein ScmC [candidate division WOR-3 bacterium]|nr:SynChlorMet cassette protein ScmC [candidate division WOR-3 bacterium]